MKKEITLGQLVGSAITIVSALVAFWITINNKVTEHSVQIKNLEEKYSEVREWMKRVDDKLDKIVLIVGSNKNMDK